MESKEIITDKELILKAEMSHYDHCVGFLRLSLVELISKAAAGYRNSNTEEGFMRMFGLLKADRTLNKKGRLFVLSIIYKHSGKKADIHGLISKFRI